MSDQSKHQLCRDPHYPWDGVCAYDHFRARLVAVGAEPIDTDSSMREINDASFELLSGLNEADRSAWKALRTAGPRLLLDFFHYQLGALQDAEPSAGKHVSGKSGAEPQEIDWQRVVELPREFPAGPDPLPCALSEHALAPEKLDIGRLNLDRREILGEAHVK